MAFNVDSETSTYDMFVNLSKAGQLNGVGDAYLERLVCLEDQSYFGMAPLRGDGIGYSLDGY